SVKRRLKNRDSAEPPKVGDDLLRQRSFELALGIQARQYPRAKKLKVIGVLVWQDYLASREPVFQCVRRNSCLSGRGARARAPLSVESVGFDLLVIAHAS